MCKRVTEKYSVCKCVYYQHGVDACASKHMGGHVIEEKVVLVGYACPSHMPPPGGRVGVLPSPTCESWK
ncbi:hypothetical protein TWF569_009569 [Orbilia oligospora]|uniref:Uncharacterized protein n=5 Tax=Orbiliaceae TaxID=47021 RepID=A0A437A3F9_ARTFL|nr:hypothetical protein AOL_s00043g415 [Orbilia oligospora ATCC 24927]KAF3084259.1 hypothetical protein TWF706_000811 [Orbilia oligospora]RVD85577.1 hypothetical protein DFL_003895 [Arthrobotrys flagrans]EGX52025.1 hypothetical protein AOL_s00043g415 [Orbilia oligospora ATCC 24927]KAF3099206.1 hypothetical protein TWF102_005611 [Orbilia oligospora]KAF3117878.1 hypothetical protein TWF103_004542 [Orbilia oligospora]